MITDDEYLKSLNEYRLRVLGLPATSKEQWKAALDSMDARPNTTQEFLQSSLPAKPAAV